LIQNSKFKILNSQSAFTLIEVLVVVAVSAVIATGGFVMFSGYQKNQNIKLTLSELTATIRDIQKRSVTQENGKQWGIRLSNGTAHSFQTWSGLSYASGTPDQTYSLKRNVQFGNPPSGFTTDLIFQAMTGILGEDRIITVNSGLGALVGDVIINTRGKVTTRIEEGLVGYWHFDEATSTVAYDASGSGNNGTLTNGPTWQTSANCKAGGCLKFDTGTQRYVNIPNSDSTDAQTTLTLSSWIYPTGVGGTDTLGTLIVSGGAYYLSFNDSSSALSCYWYSTNPPGYHSTPTNSVPLDQWSLVTCVWDGLNISEYVNGVLKNTVVVTGVGSKAGTIILGAENSSRQFEGYMDEIRIYNRALSAQEVLDIYNGLM
jgi:prepilin-type N-terminal cleavage/methylation domain-containing protein